MEFPKDKFSEWYQEVLEQAEVVDNRYPVKGCLVWRPFGFKLRSLIAGYLRQLMEATGHEETLFPALIPEDALKKEEEHVEGFKAEVYWITHGGDTPLDVKLALRPTSETAIYPMFSLWIRSHADMPLRVFQIVNTFRYETKHTRPLIRLREITTFKEAHCAFPDNASAEAQMDLINKAYSEFWDELGIPFLIVKRPEWDKFPGADYTISFDTIMPSGKTLQIATSHNLGTNFSKTFNISFEDKDGNQSRPYITCHGISDRAISSVIAIHGDNRGLVLPPRFAPVQIVIVPIIFRDREEDVISTTRKIHEKLKTKYRVVLDDTNDTPGNKFYKWELKGVPVRIEIGPKDVDSNAVTVVRRDNLHKESIPLDDLVERLDNIIEDITASMKEKARNEFESRLITVSSKEELSAWDGKPVVVKAPVCGDESCAREVEGILNKEFRGTELKKQGKGSCVICGKPARYMGVWSNAY